MAGAGSLGTFLAGALREIVIAVRAHNEAIADTNAGPDDPRVLHPSWGHVTIDSVGGSSAGALCSGQLVKALYEPEYLGTGLEIDAEGTLAGDWINMASFEGLAPEGNAMATEGGVEAPGWTLLSPAKLYKVAMEALVSKSFDPDAPRDAACALPANGIVGVGITLTDVLGYHEYAEFEACDVMGHPQFGAVEAKVAHFRALKGKEVRDLGVRKHSEVRHLFVCASEESKQIIRRFMDETDRDGKAAGHTWLEAGERLSGLAVASAALPLAFGPMALTDPTDVEGQSIRRLYMDGGVLNNKPINPALLMARWQDEIRVVSRTAYEADSFSKSVVDEELNYDRVCFFIDAFPDRTRGEWRSPHPDVALTGQPVPQTQAENVAARDQRIDDALASPSRGLGLFFESMLTSLRAQDIRGVAVTNYRIAKRAEFIRSLAGKIHHGESEFFLTDFSRVHAYVAVRRATRGLPLSEQDHLALADVVYQTDGFAGLHGRHSVTMIPVFAPKNLVEVLAGEGLYAMGGLLSREARVHDALTGQRVAQQVLRSLNPRNEEEQVTLPNPEHEALPNDTSLLVKRLTVVVEAMIEGDGSGSAFARKLVAFPFQMNPLVRLLKGRLDRTVRGEPTDDGGGR